MYRRPNGIRAARFIWGLMDIVIVESPAKAKTINKYLGSNYQVLASYGHVRDVNFLGQSRFPRPDCLETYRQIILI